MAGWPPDLFGYDFSLLYISTSVCCANLQHLFFSFQKLKPKQTWNHLNEHKFIKKRKRGKGRERERKMWGYSKTDRHEGIKKMLTKKHWIGRQTNRQTDKKTDRERQISSIKALCYKIRVKIREGEREEIIKDPKLEKSMFRITPLNLVRL